VLLPWHRSPGSCSSAQKPVSDSHPLYAGRRLPRNQAPDRLVPVVASASGFDDIKIFNDACSMGRPVEIHAYADRVAIRQDGRVVAEHARCYGRGETVYDPWHYVPVLARKPGALRNGAPFKDWVLPAALERVRRKLAGSDDGDRQMVAILSTVLTDGLPAVEAACAQAISEGVHSSDVIINILARQRDPGPAATILTPDALRLRHAPAADCARYDQLRST
jgi:hypothetical protein